MAGGTAKIAKDLGRGGRGTAERASGVDDIRAVVASLRADLVSLAAQYNQLLTDYNSHVHGGVTAGAADTSAVTDSSATAVTIGTTEE